jgi:hypothetical protein
MSSRCSRREPRAGQPYVANPVHLLRLHDAVEKVNSGAIKPRVTEGRREYRCDHVSLLLAPN